MSEVGSWPGRDEVKTATWIKRHPVVNHALFRRLHRDLHRGEAETITLAVEMKAELTLIDDADGRRTAQEYGVTTTGLVGVLLTGKEVGLIKNVKPHLDTLRGEAGFYLSERVYRVALDLADET